MYCVGVRVKNVCEYYRMKQPTVSNIIRRYRKSEQTIVKKKIGRPRKLSSRGMRLLQKYIYCILDNCSDPLYITASKFNATTKLQLSESIVRR